MTVYLITVGDEILVGQIVDTNANWMAKQLNLAGAEVVGIRTVGDDLAEIQAALTDALAKADAVLMTGGLGPTKDDVTKRALADFFAVPLEFHQPTYDRIVRIFERLGRTAKDVHRQQAFMPANAELLLNKMGTAPGMWFEHNGRILVSMPGVPHEMQYLLEHEVLPRLRQRYPGPAIAHRTILTAGEGESTIAERLASFEDSLPPQLRLAYLPSFGQVRLRLTARGQDEYALNHLLDSKVRELIACLPDLVFGFENEQLEEVIGNLLRRHKLTLGTAESCTGGFLAHRITTVPGSSDYFMGSIVAYSNALKERLLHVRPDTLGYYGAVSPETVREMVAGALDTLGVDVAVAVSGIAGPGGGTPEKPVGTIWMAIGNREVIETKKLHTGKDRLKNIEYSATLALNLIRTFLLKYYGVASAIQPAG